LRWLRPSISKLLFLQPIFEIENGCAQKLPQKKIHYNIKEVNAMIYNKIEKARVCIELRLLITREG